MTVIRHRPLVRITHWLNAIFLAGMIGSGLQIYTAYGHIGFHGETFNVPNPFDASRMAIPHAVKLGGWLAGGLRWHFTLAWPFVLTGLAYVLFLVFSGEWRALLFRPRDVPGAWQMTRYYLRLRRDHSLGLRHRQADPACVPDDALRRLRMGSVLAFRRRVDIHRVHRCARRDGLRR